MQLRSDETTTFFIMIRAEIMLSVGNVFRGMSRNGAAVLFLLAVAMPFSASHTAFAQGGQLAVAPTRVVFEGRTRSAQLSLVNKGAKTATFRIRVVNLRMDDSGNMKEIDKADPGQQFAGKLFRYSPRQITLKPGASQAIRLLLRKPKDLAAGEYRSHLMMQNVPTQTGQSIEQTQGADGVQIRMVPVFGITIPVIVRHGKTAADVALSNLSIIAADKDNKTPRLRFTVGRNGNRSAFGDLTATLRSGGNEVVLGQIMRLAVYTPNASRTVMMPLRVPDGVNLSGGSVHVAYRHIKDNGGKLMGEAELKVP